MQLWLSQEFWKQMTDSDVTFDLGADYDLISDVHDNPRDWISLRRRATAMFTHQALHKYTARCADFVCGSGARSTTFAHRNSSPLSKNHWFNDTTHGANVRDTPAMLCSGRCPSSFVTFHGGRIARKCKLRPQVWPHYILATLEARIGCMKHDLYQCLLGLQLTY